MNRRTFMKSAVAGVAVLLAPPFLDKLKLTDSVAPRVPILYGDGSHDDAPALQAWLDGRPIEIRDGAAKAEKMRLKLNNGTYRIGKTLHFDGTDNQQPLTIEGSTITADKSLEGPMIRVDKANSSILHGVHDIHNSWLLRSD